jgi:hypothetical protein
LAYSLKHIHNVVQLSPLSNSRMFSRDAGDIFGRGEALGKAETLAEPLACGRWSRLLF